MLRQQGKVGGKMLKKIGIVLIILFLLIVVLLVWLSVKKSVPNKYWQKAETGGAIEEKYAALGCYEVDSKRFDAPETGVEPGKRKFYEVWYPKAEGTYPLIVMVNGTGEFDAETVIPLEYLEKNYGELTDDKVMYRRANTDHGDMLYRANAYIIAWLDYYLKGEKENERAFFGENAEISKNTYYQDFRSEKLD